MNLDAIRQSTIHVMRDQVAVNLRVTTVVACCLELCDEVERLRGKPSVTTAASVEMEWADEREEMARDTDEADERRQEMRDELRIEHERQIDDDIRRAAAYYEDPRD